MEFFLSGNPAHLLEGIFNGKFGNIRKLFAIYFFVDTLSEFPTSLEAVLNIFYLPNVQTT